MRLCVLLAAALSAGVALAAPAPFPRPERQRVRDDLLVMQGMWRMLVYESSGSAIGNHYKVKIHGNRWTFITTQGMERETASYEYNLDTKVTPRAFEWKSAPNSDSGWVGSYKLEGMRLTIIFQSGSLKQVHTRPMDFNGRPSYRMVLEKIGS